MKTRLLVALVELAGASFITYQQLPEDQKQHVRMVTYASGEKVMNRIAYRVGLVAIWFGNRYYQEVSANG